MPQVSKISKNNTTTTIDGHGRIDSVTLHHTRILEIDWGKGEITVNTGGYNTVTTQTRLNQAFNQLGLPFRASRKGGVMVIHKTDRSSDWQCWTTF